LLHGSPGSRLLRPPDEEAVRRIGVRLITYDRPGYGVSDRAPGRAMVDCTADVASIADELGVGLFRVQGRSFGGPHALAVAARLGERVVRASCVVSPAPADAPGLDLLVGMDPVNVRLFHIAQQGEEVLHPEMEHQASELLQRIAVHPGQFLSKDWQLDEADRSVLGDTAMQQMINENMREAFRSGVWGWVDDGLAAVKPWGFELSEIKVPVEIRYGAKDVLVPSAHGTWLAANVPGARAVVTQDAGHFSEPTAMVETLRLLAQDE
jgi:pimeloyl-ACP methyl ester carboxylesterase